MKQFAMNSAKSDGTTDLAEPGGAVGETIMANHETKTPRVMGVGHVALNARDPAALAEFLSRCGRTLSKAAERFPFACLFRKGLSSPTVKHPRCLLAERK